MIDERKNVQTTPPAPTASTEGPCPTIILISRTPRHWKFTQHHRTTRPPQLQKSRQQNFLLQSFKKMLSPSYIILRIQRLESKECRSRWGGSWWATSSRSTLFANSAILISGRVKGRPTIGVGRFGIFGGQSLEYCGGANSQQAHDVIMTLMRCQVALTSFQRHMPTRFLINQCQISAFLILKSYIIQNSRIELRGIVLLVPSNQLKVTFIIILPFSLVHLWFLPVSHRNWRKMWVDLWLGGQRVCWRPSLKLLGGGPPSLPSSLFLRLCQPNRQDLFKYCHNGN